MDSKLIILLIIAGVLLMLTLGHFLIRYYKAVNADEVKVELDEEITTLKVAEEPVKEEQESIKE